MKRKILSTLLGCCMCVTIVLPCLGMVDGWKSDGRTMVYVYDYYLVPGGDECKMPTEPGGQCRGKCHYARTKKGVATVTYDCKDVMGGQYGTACRCSNKIGIQGEPPSKATVQDTVNIRR